MNPFLFDAVQLGLFLFLMIAPCGIAVIVSAQADEPLEWELDGVAGKVPAALGEGPEVRMAWPETQPTDQFEIRSFPKGLEHRRKLALERLEAAQRNLVEMARVEKHDNLTIAERDRAA